MNHVVCCAILRKMAFGGVPVPTGLDPNAGYLVEDESDLEFSECEDSSGVSDGGEEDRRQARSLMGSSAGERSSEDDFEEQMANELDEMIDRATTAHTVPHVVPAADMEQGVSLAAALKEGMPTGTPKGKGEKKVEGTTEQRSAEYYDDVYFSSSSSMGEEEDGADGGDESKDGGWKKKKKKTKHRVLTNDELFYDPDMDEDDQKWVNRQRMAYHNVALAEEIVKEKTSLKEDRTHEENQMEMTEQGKPRVEGPETVAVPTSDAILSCPACLTTLCLDCQRHEVYETQYRAMFVLNCKVLKDEVLRYKPKQKKHRKKGQGASKDCSSDAFNPVRCNVCNTEVAVYDADEVFHFFNVLASNP